MCQFTKIPVPALTTSHAHLKGAKKCLCGPGYAGWCTMSSVNECFSGHHNQQDHTVAALPTCAGLAPRPLRINGKDCTLIYLAWKGILRQSSEIIVYQGELGWRLQESSQLLAILLIQGMIIHYLQFTSCAEASFKVISFLLWSGIQILQIKSSSPSLQQGNESLCLIPGLSPNAVELGATRNTSQLQEVMVTGPLMNTQMFSIRVTLHAAHIPCGKELGWEEQVWVFSFIPLQHWCRDALLWHGWTGALYTLGCAVDMCEVSHIILPSLWACTCISCLYDAWTQWLNFSVLRCMWL